MIGPKIRRARAPPIAAIVVRFKSSATIRLTAAAPSRPTLARHPRSRPRTGWDQSARGNRDTGLARCLAVKATVPKPSKPTNAGTALAMTWLQAARTASMPTTTATIRPRARPITLVLQILTAIIATTMPAAIAPLVALLLEFSSAPAYSPTATATIAVTTALTAYTRQVPIADRCPRPKRRFRSSTVPEAAGGLLTSPSNAPSLGRPSAGRLSPHGTRSASTRGTALQLSRAQYPEIYETMTGYAQTLVQPPRTHPWTVRRLNTVYRLALFRDAGAKELAAAAPSVSQKGREGCAQPGGGHLSARSSDRRWRHTKAIPVRIAAAPVTEQVQDKEDRDPEDAAGLNRAVGRDDDEHEGGPGQE